LKSVFPIFIVNDHSQSCEALLVKILNEIFVEPAAAAAAEVRLINHRFCAETVSLNII
jgi:hypothetical protein